MTKINKSQSLENSMKLKEMGDGRWEMGAVTTQASLSNRLSPIDKKLSSTLAHGLSSSLKLFLVILVLFGMIGGVFAGAIAPKAESSTTSSTSPSVTTSDSKSITINNVKFDIVKATVTKETLYKTEDYYYDVVGYRVNEKGYYIDNEKKELTAKPKSSSNNNIEKRTLECQKTPLSCSNVELTALNSIGIKPNTEGWGTVYSNLQTFDTNYKTAEKNYNDACSTTPKANNCDTLKTAKETAKTNLDNANNLILNSGDISSALTSMTEDQRKVFLENYNKNKCGDGWTSSICKMFNQESAESLAVKKYNEKVNLLDQGKIDPQSQKKLYDAKTELDTCDKKHLTACSEKQTKYMEEYNKELLNMALSGLTPNLKALIKSKCTDIGEINAECKTLVQDQITLKCNSEGNVEDCKQFKLFGKQIESGYLKTQVETTPLYDILTAILNPDSNSIKAAKLFGFEANYANVPAFLKESIPSQICLAKIDGYLDKTKPNSVNGQGGLTSYGCSQDYTQMYNEQTKKYEKVPNTQCLEVLADLRAQRTQVTPDGKTFISYSYYIKAPPNTQIKYVIAISYKEGNTIKKKQIIDLTTLNGTKNGFDSVEIALNGSVDNIDENSFTINLLAIYSNKNVYQKLSYPIKPIVTGDSYSAPIPGKVSSSNQNGASSGASQAAELSTDDMLRMI